MKKFKKIGLVVAMIEEQQHLYSSLGEVVGVYEYGNIKVTEFKYNNTQIYMADSGIGEISATMATQLLIIKYGVELVLNFGVVGSLSKDIKCPDIVYVGEIVHYDFTTLYSDPDSFGKYTFQPDSFVFKANKEMLDVAKELIGDYPTARIASGDKFINDSAMKSWLINHFGGEICDMESAGIYMACCNHNIPFLMIKAVSDNADENAFADLDLAVRNGVTFYIDAVKKIIANLAE